MKQPNLLENAKYQLNLVISFISMIDGRAAVVLGLNIGLLGILALNFTSIDFIYIWPVIFPVITLTLSVMSLYHIYKCFYPQLSGGDKSIVYFKEVANRTKNTFITEFKDISNKDYAEEILAQTWRNSQIVKAKFEHLKSAFIYLLVNLVPALVSLVFLGIENKQFIVK